MPEANTGSLLIASKPVYNKKQTNAPLINATTVLLVKLLVQMPMEVNKAPSINNPI